MALISQEKIKILKEIPLILKIKIGINHRKNKL
jgi:hypothetical protein